MEKNSQKQRERVKEREKFTKTEIKRERGTHSKKVEKGAERERE